MPITIQYRDPGMDCWGTINYMTGDNTNLAQSTLSNQEKAYNALKERCVHFVGEWSKIFPDTQFRVNEDVL